MRRALRLLSTALLVAGALALTDAVLTLVWQEPVSALYHRLQQGGLEDRLEAMEREPPPPVERRALRLLPSPERRLAFAARALDRRVDAGQPLGRIDMPSIGVSTFIVAGTDDASLRKGPGHYPGTPLPGARGTVGIAGHRTTYGAPFRRLDGLDRGDRIEVRMPYGSFTYAVERTRIVAPSATWVTRRVGYDRLVLTACHPLYSAAQRIVVFARLVDSEPRGPALAA